MRSIATYGTVPERPSRLLNPLLRRTTFTWTRIIPCPLPKLRYLSSTAARLWDARLAADNG